MERRRATIRYGLALLVVAASVCGGCSQQKKPVATMSSPFPKPMTLAVAPVLNFTGELGFDPVRCADLLASELCDVENISVLPVNRVVAYLAMQGRQQVESPAHAVAVAEAVGADAILVAGITEYDPYTPVVGLALQMYTVSRPSLEEEPAEDAVAGSADSRPLLASEQAGPASPSGQVQIIYNANHEWVVKAVRHYADDRSEDAGPYGWRQYLRVQTLFLRFCWHDAVERLMQQEGRRRTMLADVRSTEVP